MIRREITPNCPDCGVAVGEPHVGGCDIARCLVTGWQDIACGGETHVFKGRWYGEHEGECGEDVWTGYFPGVQECWEYGLYAKLVPGRGWVPTTEDDPDASEDLNRLVSIYKWDKDLHKYVPR